MCMHIHTPTRMCPSSSVNNGPSSLTFSLGSSSCWEHCHSPPTSFLGPLGWGRGRRTSKEGHSLPLVCLCLCVGPVHTCPELGGVMEVICGPWSHTEGLAACHCHHQPTPIFSSFSGPEPGATPQVPTQSPRCCPFSLLPGCVLPQPSWFSQCWGGLGSVTPTTVQSTPSAGSL